MVSGLFNLFGHCEKNKSIWNGLHGGLAGGRLFTDNERSKYPYTGISVRSEDAALLDEPVIEDVQLDTLMLGNDMVIEGMFIGEPQLVEVKIWPEEGTNEYLVTQSLAKEFDKPFEEMVPKFEYYKLDFAPITTMYSALDEASAEIRSVYVEAEKWEQFPDPQKYSHAVLFAYDFPYGEEHAMLTSIIGYYYVSDENKIYLGMKLHGSFSGTTASTLKCGSSNVSNVVIVGVEANITSSAALSGYADTYINRNVFFNYTAELGVNYTITD